MPEADMGLSNLEMELMGYFSSGIGIAYLKKMELELIKLELKFATKYLIYRLIYHLTL